MSPCVLGLGFDRFIGSAGPINYFFYIFNKIPVQGGGGGGTGGLKVYIYDPPREKGTKLKIDCFRSFDSRVFLVSITI